jgi:Nickel responsive protein SCO4226-like
VDVASLHESDPVDFQALTAVAEYLIETYVARTDTDAVGRGGELARAAAEELLREGTAVRYLRSMFVPEDETCFYVCEADSADAVRAAAERAALSAARVVAAETVPNGSQDDSSLDGWVSR